MRTLVLLTLASVLTSQAAHGASVAPGVLGPIDHIAEAEVVVLYSSPCFFRVELVDSVGNSLLLCSGSDPKRPHHGLRFGPTYEDSTSLQVIPIGSPAEERLLALIHDYLNRTYSFRRLEEMQRPDSLRAIRTDHDAKVLLGMLQYRARGMAIQRWLTANFSAEHQLAIAATPYAQLASDKEREAAWLICEMKNGVFAGRGPSDEAGCFGAN